MADNPRYRQQWIFDLLKNNATLSYNDCFTCYFQKFTKSRVTFTKDWNIALVNIKGYQSKLKNRKEEVSITIEVEALKQGLKLKIDRLMFYQNQIEIMENQLFGFVKFKFIVSNQILNSHDKEGVFVLPLEKQNEIRKQIKEYQSEISKIEGDYASIKKDITSNGESLNLNPEQKENRIKELLKKANDLGL